MISMSCLRKDDTGTCSPACTGLPKNETKIEKYSDNGNKIKAKNVAKVATVLGSIPASSDTVESEGRQMRQ